MSTSILYCPSYSDMCSVLKGFLEPPLSKRDTLLNLVSVSPAIVTLENGGDCANDTLHKLMKQKGQVLNLESLSLLTSLSILFRTFLSFSMFFATLPTAWDTADSLIPNCVPMVLSRSSVYR